jgi:hypothetical protein
MECNFCHQDVPDPCKDASQVHDRAAAHVERCEDAEKEEHLAADDPRDLGMIAPPAIH